MFNIFINSKNKKTAKTYRLLLNFTDKIDFKRNNKYVALLNLSIYYTCTNIKKSCKNDKFKILSTTRKEEFELPDESYSVSELQDYFEYILKNIEERLIILQ